MKNSSGPRSEETERLEFPDWSGMVDSSQMVAPETAFRLIEEYYRLLPERSSRWHQERWEQKVKVEFVL